MCSCYVQTSRLETRRKCFLPLFSVLHWVNHRYKNTIIKKGVNRGSMVFSACRKIQNGLTVFEGISLYICKI